MRTTMKSIFLILLFCLLTACTPPDVASTTSSTPPPDTATPAPTRDLDNLSFSLIDMLEPDRLEFKGMPWWCEKDTMFEALGIPEDFMESLVVPPPNAVYKVNGYVEELACDAIVLFETTFNRFHRMHIYVDYEDEAEYEALHERFTEIANELAKSNPEMQEQVERFSFTTQYNIKILNGARRESYIASLPELAKSNSMFESLSLWRERAEGKRARPGAEDNGLKMVILNIGFYQS